jgi:hypothetical protein
MMGMGGGQGGGHMKMCPQCGGTGVAPAATSPSTAMPVAAPMPAQAPRLDIAKAIRGGGGHGGHGGM